MSRSLVSASHSGGRTRVRIIAAVSSVALAMTALQTVETPFTNPATASATPTNSNFELTRHRPDFPDTSNAIDADAVAAGKVRLPVRMQTLPRSISGHAYINSDCGYNTSYTVGGVVTGRCQTVPEGTTVYAQWQDIDGQTSPVYKAKTHTVHSVGGGIQSNGGPGLYVFQFPDFVDDNGKAHTFRPGPRGARGKGPVYRLWIEPFADEQTGNELVMMRQSAGIVPGKWAETIVSKAGAVPIVGLNVQKTAVWMYQTPGEYMMKPKANWKHQDGLNTYNSTTRFRNLVAGRVWLETGDWDLLQYVTGPKKAPSERPAEGFKVVGVALTPEGARAFKNLKFPNYTGWKKRRAEAKAQKDLLEQHPEWIAETVYTTVNANGVYALQFSEGFDNNMFYAFVLDQEDNIVPVYSPWTYGKFNRPNEAGTEHNINPISLPLEERNSVEQLHFAVVIDPDTTLPDPNPEPEPTPNPEPEPTPNPEPEPTPNPEPEPTPNPEPEPTPNPEPEPTPNPEPEPTPNPEPEPTPNPEPEPGDGYDPDGDIDGDGIPNKDDSDMDGDGVNNADETAAGLDPTKDKTDGVNNDGDRDEDKDGIPNKDESDENSHNITDKNNNGVPDLIDPEEKTKPKDPNDGGFLGHLSSGNLDATSTSSSNKSIIPVVLGLGALAAVIGVAGAGFLPGGCIDIPLRDSLVKQGWPRNVADMFAGAACNLGFRSPQPQQ